MPVLQAFCDTGYIGTPQVALCTSAGPYSVSGCVAKCKRPTTTTGYNVNSEDDNCFKTDGDKGTCEQSLSCATGYVGSPIVTLCTSPEVLTPLQDATTHAFDRRVPSGII